MNRDKYEEEIAKLKRRIDMLERKAYRPKSSPNSWSVSDTRVGFGKGRSCE
ncbi:hypothetical protein P9E09_07195 [Bacillus mojavensis]|uniref:hypothetical protein n=1 Tax=Bacillus mojavensis TaxID=72360 RepID=UPI002DB83A8F|nr:hypothetical protein [Bacillus mojavensis]MEC1707439.1 hypothetical protein [Bacillus mojavensis]